MTEDRKEQEARERMAAERRSRDARAAAIAWAESAGFEPDELYVAASLALHLKHARRGGEVTATEIREDPRFAERVERGRR